MDDILVDTQPLDEYFNNGGGVKELGFKKNFKLSKVKVVATPRGQKKNAVESSCQATIESSIDSENYEKRLPRYSHFFPQNNNNNKLVTDIKQKLRDRHKALLQS